MSPRIEWDLRTADLSSVRRTVSRVLKPYSLETGAAAVYDARILHRRLISADFAVIDYGSAAIVDAGQMKNFYLLQVPLAGSYTLCVDGSRTLVNRGDMHLIHPRVSLRMELSENCRLLVVRTSDPRLAQIEQRQRRGELRASLGYILARSSTQGASLTRALDYLTAELMQGKLIAARREFASVAESLLLGALLEAAADLSRSSFERPANPIELACGYIRDNLGAELSSIAIVAASGTSRRRLFDGFKHAFDEGPMTYARRLRLQRVYAQLRSIASVPRGISDIASESGFSHFGHFCAAYRALFGETPSDTRRRATLKATSAQLPCAPAPPSRSVPRRRTAG
jgi:AraC-like DNA-binding protein